MSDPVVVRMISVLEYFEKTCNREHVDATAFRIVEEVVRRTRSFTSRDFLSGLCVKNKHSRRGPGCDELAVMGLGARRRKNTVCRGVRLAREDKDFDTVNDVGSQ